MTEQEKNKLIGEAIQELRKAEQCKHDSNMRYNIDNAIGLLRQALGWPPGYFDETAGCLADDPMERAPQGEYKGRE